MCTPLFSHSQSHCCIGSRSAPVFAHGLENKHQFSFAIGRLVDCFCVVVERREDDTAKISPW